MDKELKDVLQLARKMELDGIDFYSKAAARATNEQAERFFKSLVQDEERHLSIIEKISEGFGVDISSMPMPADNIRTVFSELSGEEGTVAPVDAEEKDAVETALEMEKKSYDLYAGAAAQEDSDELKKLLERLSKEENQHYVMLQNTSDYLNDTGRWFLHNECGLLTGDMSSLG